MATEEIKTEATQNDTKNGQSEENPTKEENKKSEDKKADPRKEARYSDEDLDRIIDKKFAKWKAEEAERVEEAKRLATMNATEKAEHERDLEKKRADEAEAKLTRYGLTSEARSMLSKESIVLNEDLLTVLVGKDAETTKANVDSFVELFRDAVDSEVKKRIAGKTPKAGEKAGLTKADIMNVKDPNERKKLIAENIELFR